MLLVLNNQEARPIPFPQMMTNYYFCVSPSAPFKNGAMAFRCRQVADNMLLVCLKNCDEKYVLFVLQTIDFNAVLSSSGI
jgi:hypothetical protein